MSHSRTFKTAVLGSGKFLAALTTLITFAVLSRLFTKADYAAYRQTLLAYTFLSPLLTLGLPMALYYFLPQYPKNGRSILSGNLLLLFFMGCIFAIVIWCGGAEFLAEKFNNSKLARLLLIYSPYALLALPVTAISACLVSCNKVTLLTIFNVSSRFLFFPFVIGFVLIWRTPAAAISGTVLTAFLIFIPALFIMFGATTGETWKPARKNMWKQLKYSAPLGLAGMFGIISMNLDKALVSFMCPPEVFAVYANGAIEIPMIGIITGSVMAILMPEFALLFHKKEHEKIISLWHSAMIKCAMVIFPIMMFLYILAPELIQIIFSAEYEKSAIPFRIYLLILPIRITQFGAVLMANGKSSWVLIRTVIMLLLNTALSIFLIRHTGYTGAAIATVIVIYGWSVPFNLIAISKICQVSYAKMLPYRKLLTIGIISIVSGVLCFTGNSYLPISNDIVRLAIICPVYIVVTIGLMIWSGLLRGGFWRNRA